MPDSFADRYGVAFAAALPLYCDWLNAMCTSIDDFEFKPEQFDPSANEYAEIRTICDPYAMDEYTVRTWSVYDGDEGGPAYLTVYFTLDGQPWHATQNFDTYLTVWLTDGKIVPVAS